MAKNTINQTQLKNNDGWQKCPESATYVSEFSIKFNGFNVDLTLSRGMKLKLVNTTVKYFTIIDLATDGSDRAMILSGPVALVSGAITNLYFSTEYMPYDFTYNYNYDRLGYDTTTSTNQSGIVGEVAVTDLSLTVDVPAGKSVEIITSGQYYGGDIAQTNIKCDGVTVKAGRCQTSNVTSLQFTMIASHTPSPGSHTYTASVGRITGSGTILLENEVAPFDILVKAI